MRHEATIIVNISPKLLAVNLAEIRIKSPFLPTYGFADQGKSFVMCSFPILPI